MRLALGRAPRLRARITARIQELEARAWDSVVSTARMSHEANRALDDVLVSRDSLYALVSDEDGPYAAITSKPHNESAVLRRVLSVSPHLGRFGGIQLRSGVTLDTALPRLLPTLARMARKRGCAAFSVVAPAAERELFSRSGFVSFGGPPPNTSDLSGLKSYDELVSRLPGRGRELRRSRRRSEQFGLRFEITSPPRAATDTLFALTDETFRAHGTTIPFSPGFFERVWAANFADHLLFAAYREDRLIAALWCYRHGEVLTVATPAIDYELARPSYAYFSLLDEVVRWALAHAVRTIEWGISNDAIKSRYGGVAVPAIAAVRPAFPLPAPIWGGLRAILASPAAARALGVSDD